MSQRTPHAGPPPSRAARARYDGAVGGSDGDLPGAMLRARAVRHTGWNLAGVLLPLLVGLFAIPILTRQLGAARFGVLGLAWMLLEYFSLFDAGLGRATVRAVAAGRELLRAHLGRDGAGAGRELSATVTGSVVIQLLLGVLAGLALAMAAPMVVERLLRAPQALAGEATRAIRVLGATVPALMLGLALRGMLEAAERFDLSNGIRIPLSIGTFLVPAAVAMAGGGLPSIMVALLILRVLSVAVQAVVIRRALPGFMWCWPEEWSGVRALLAFGGWVAVSNVISPVLVYVDRLAVGGLLGAAALGYYTAPFEASLRLLVFPAAVVTALYPMASALLAAGDVERMRALYVGAVRVLAGGMAGIAIVGVVLAPELLSGWLGAEYAENGALALRLLCVGVLVNAVVHVPFAFIQAAGRPDIMARFHLLELAIHLPLTYWLVDRYGIPGAAGAWALRALMDATLVFGAARRVLGVGVGAVTAGRSLRAMGLALALVVALMALQWVAAASPVAAGADSGTRGLMVALIAILPLGLHSLLSWRWLLSASERSAMLGAVRRG